MNKSEKLQILEALLFAAPEPLTQTRVNLIFQNDAPKLDDAIKRMQIFSELGVDILFIEAIKSNTP